MAVVDGAALLVLTFKEEELDLNEEKVMMRSGNLYFVHDEDDGVDKVDELADFPLLIYLVSEVVNLGDQPRSALHLPAKFFL